MATLSDMGLMVYLTANNPHVCCFYNHVYNDPLLVVHCRYRPLCMEHIA